MKRNQVVERDLSVVERAAWWNPRVRRILKAAPMVVLFLLLTRPTAHAACSFNPTPDPTADGSSNSLRHAIRAANASGQDCLIQLQSGTYTLTIINSTGQENGAAQGDLDITGRGHTLTVSGRGAGVSIVNGNSIDRVFQVLGGANANFNKLTIEGGIARDDGAAHVLPTSTTAEGGGLLVQGGGHVTLSQVSLTRNQAVGGLGTDGVSTKSSAAAAGSGGKLAEGGGLFLANGAISLTRSQVSANAAIAGSGGNGASVSCTYVPTSMGSRLSCPGFSGTGGVGGAAAGGGLYILSGSATVIQSTVSGNSTIGAFGGGGGGFFASTIDGCCRVGGDGGAAQGAGLFIQAGSLSLTRSTIAGSSATGGAGGFGGDPAFTPRPAASGGSSQGGGLFVANGSTSVANSTVFANNAKGGTGGSGRSLPFGRGGNAAGGGLYLNNGSVSLTGVTTVSNQALLAEGFSPGQTGSSSGGGIANQGAGLFINTTLIGNNTMGIDNIVLTASDVFGAITTSHSLISEDAGALITDHGRNIFNVNPRLDPNGLKSNGGPTQTVALQQVSPAIDKGDNVTCAAPFPSGLANVDQRGFPRFRTGDSLCDIGAFEFVNLLVEPTSLSFGSETVGQETHFQNLPITNNQTRSVSLSRSVAGADPADFVVVANCHSSLTAQSSCTISVAFRPKAAGPRTAQLTVTDGPDRTSPYHVTLAGTGK